MVKKRPITWASTLEAQTGPDRASKFEAAYWERRLFKNTFTYKGRRREVRGWSLKIQLSGRRKTFTVYSGNKAQAALEAARIYQTLVTRGWDAVGQHRWGIGFQAHLAKANADSAATVEFNLEHWKGRLINRRYPENGVSQLGRELSVRIEHGGVSRYLPLGTNNESQAAVQAMRIHQVVVGQGWAVANQKFTRELTLAFRWLEDPLAWTYTTFHTWKNGDAIPRLTDQNSRPTTRNITIIEPDAGIRLALAASVNSQQGFNCCAAHRSGAEALREITRQPIDLVLTNYALPNQPGISCLQELQRAKPTVVGLLYSVFEDSDHLFKSTPGGAAGYMLKRTPSHRIFDPIAETTEPLTREHISAKIREYFQRLVAAMPAGPSALDMAKLTPREHETLALLAKGSLAKEIADALGISIWTVHGHVKSIFEKLHVHTRTEAVVKFLQK